MTAYNWSADPRRLAFQAARYLFVAKMLEGKMRVLEVGCADGQGARIVRQHVGSLMAIDSDARSIAEAERLMSPRWPVEFRVGDVLKGALPRMDAVYCLDLFEHIAAESQLLTALHAIAPVCIIGTPSLESQAYASEISKAGHVNCVTKSGLRKRMCHHWRHVFMFGMNDNTLHCGFDEMTHYLFGIGCD